MNDAHDPPQSGIRTSTTIGKIAGALAAAQAGLGSLTKTSTVKIPTKSQGPDIKYNYADLASALAVVRPALSAAEIAVVQGPSSPGNGGVEVETLIVHSSGEWLSSTLWMPVQGDAKAVGSAITYARRYALLAMVGLAAEDDDAGEATREPPRRQTAARAPEVVKPRAESRCVGTAAPIAEAIRTRSRALSVMFGADHELAPYWDECRNANWERLADGSYPKPEQLFVSHGIAISKVLAMRLEREAPDEVRDPT